jgi:hypothetical protein
MATKCPNCQGESVIVGKIYNQVDYINPSAYFRPSNVPFYAIFKSVQFENNFSACQFCGTVWSKLDNQQLQNFAFKKAAF